MITYPRWDWSYSMLAKEAPLDAEQISRHYPMSPTHIFGFFPWEVIATYIWSLQRLTKMSHIINALLTDRWHIASYILVTIGTDKPTSYTVRTKTCPKTLLTCHWNLQRHVEIQQNVFDFGEAVSLKCFEIMNNDRHYVLVPNGTCL